MPYNEGNWIENTKKMLEEFGYTLEEDNEKEMVFSKLEGERHHWIRKYNKIDGTLDHYDKNDPEFKQLRDVKCK